MSFVDMFLIFFLGLSAGLIGCLVWAVWAMGYLE